jgi:hypothetical protein
MKLRIEVMITSISGINQSDHAVGGRWSRATTPTRERSSETEPGASPTGG